MRAVHTHRERPRPRQPLGLRVYPARQPRGKQRKLNSLSQQNQDGRFVRFYMYQGLRAQSD